MPIDETLWTAILKGGGAGGWIILVAVVWAVYSGRLVLKREIDNLKQAHKQEMDRTDNRCAEAVEREKADLKVMTEDRDKWMQLMLESVKLVKDVRKMTREAVDTVDTLTKPRR